MNRRGFLKGLASAAIWPSLGDGTVEVAGPLLWFDEPTPPLPDVWAAIEKLSLIHDQKLGLTELLYGLQGYDAAGRDPRPAGGNSGQV